MNKFLMKTSMILFFGVFMLTACGEVPNQGVQMQDITKQDLPENIDWNRLQEQLHPSVLQIECGDYKGSGVIWSIDEKYVTILTNKHLLKEDENSDVIFYQGEYYQADNIWLSDQYDIGLARIAVSDMDETDLEALQAVTYEKKEATETTYGEEVAIYGSKEYIADSFLKGYIEQAEIPEEELETYQKQTGVDVGKSLMLGFGDVQAGMSGSGVFDQRGNLVGIIVGGNGEGNFLAVQIWNILNEISSLTI